MLSTDECGSGGNLGDGGSMHDDVSVQGETNFNDVHAWVGQGWQWCKVGDTLRLTMLYSLEFERILGSFLEFERDKDPFSCPFLFPPSLTKMASFIFFYFKNHRMTWTGSMECRFNQQPSCHTLISSRDHPLLGCDPRLTTLRYLAPIVRKFVKFRDMPEVKRKRCSTIREVPWHVGN